MLFNLVRGVTLHSGASSDWLIDCSALTNSDLEALAYLGRDLVGPFGTVFGVPTGGLRFAAAMREYATPSHPLAIIVDDVFTTGASMEAMRRQVFGVHNTSGGLVIFARGPCPSWIQAIWSTGLR